MCNEKKILIVDDDEVMLSMVKAILEPDYDARIAKSGKEALELIVGGFLPDLILLDILMPEMDGFDVYNKIRAISLLENIPIVFLSSVTEEQEIQRAMNIGAADYIKKPYKKDDLLARIKKIMDK